MSRIDQEMISAMASAYEGGDTLRTIADRYSVSSTTVWRHLQTEGCHMRSSGGHTKGRLKRSHPLWRGGYRPTVNGYIYVRVYADDPNYDMANGAGCVMEHRLVMAKSLGRSLAANETVHHINGDRRDNRIENLQLRSGAHGAGQVFCCMECGSNNVKAVEIHE
jgi:hypothetical protein